MKVSVYEKVLFVFDKKIAFGSTTFLLTKLLNGNISVSQDEESEEQSDLTLLSTKEETNLTVTLHDPSGFLDNSTITYSWNIDKLVFIDAGPSLTYNFSRPGKYNIGVTVVAFFVPIASQFQKNNTGTDMTKWGRFSRQVTAKGILNVLKDTKILHT
ncbi:protein QNR-71-like, partial [Limulus polyphemus]|uniref:Protein QNR-71-like n=1 Tax=Limulus polyphemus TaxID=6850 RepID=A0ABM1RYA8_LIMPO